MRAYIFKYSSERNCFSGTLVVLAANLPEAQGQFFRWLRQQPTFEHLWQMTFSCECGEILEGNNRLRAADVTRRDEIKRLADECCEHASNNMDVLAWSCIDEMEAILREMKP